MSDTGPQKELSQARETVRLLQAELEQTNSELLQLTLDLESRVSERTAELQEARDELEVRVQERTAELRAANEELRREVAERKRAQTETEAYAAQLEVANRELESFSYSVSHDLRTPLRGIDGFSQALLEDYGDRLDDQGKGFLRRVRTATQRMARLIDDLLILSGITRKQIARETVDLSALALTGLEALQRASPDRHVEVVVTAGAIVKGDPHLLRIALDNLLGNAWKFSEGRRDATVEFGIEENEDGTAYFVRDNGVGFDMAYVDKLFGPFQRLHLPEEFSGSGIGLATVKRIVERHGGRVWASGAVGEGAKFAFTLNNNG